MSNCNVVRVSFSSSFFYSLKKNYFWTERWSRYEATFYGVNEIKCAYRLTWTYYTYSTDSLIFLKYISPVTASGLQWIFGLLN